MCSGQTSGHGEVNLSSRAVAEHRGAVCALFQHKTLRSALWADPSHNFKLDGSPMPEKIRLSKPVVLIRARSVRGCFKVIFVWKPLTW
jgi:hypothetical protein